MSGGKSNSVRVSKEKRCNAETEYEKRSEVKRSEEK